MKVLNHSLQKVSFEFPLAFCTNAITTRLRKSVKHNMKLKKRTFTLRNRYTNKFEKIGNFGWLHT